MLPWMSRKKATYIQVTNMQMGTVTTKFNVEVPQTAKNISNT